MQKMTQITLISLTTKYTENWKQTQKIREITYKDQGEEVHGCELCVVEFREKEKNKEDQGEEVRGCGLCG